MHKSKVLKAACAAAGLATAWGGGQAKASSFLVSGYVQPTKALTDVVVTNQFYRTNTSGVSFFLYHLPSACQAGVQTPFEFTFTDDSDPTDVLMPGNYAVFGLYDSAANGVSVSMRDGAAQDQILFNHTWSQCFGEVPSVPKEAAIAGDLKAGVTGNVEYMSYFYAVGGPYGESQTIVNFSGATDGGATYAQATPVPEPVTLTIAAPLVALVVAGRRRGRVG